MGGRRVTLSSEELARHLLASSPVQNIWMVCDCGDREVEITPDMDPVWLDALIQHAAFDHATPHSILRRETVELVKSSELKILLGLS
jgi:hypothetical protein